MQADDWRPFVDKIKNDKQYGQAIGYLECLKMLEDNYEQAHGALERRLGVIVRWSRIWENHNEGFDKEFTCKWGGEDEKNNS